MPRWFSRFRDAALLRFRGPCEPSDGELGPVRGADARVAREFYRFAADPSLGGPFGTGGIRVGIESGPTKVYVPESQRNALTAWQVDTSYAERSGPFSPLDILASSGGYYEVHRGVLPACGFDAAGADAPPELEGLRAVTLTVPRDVVSACMDWWGVTLFLDSEGYVRGVALRLGSP